MSAKMLTTSGTSTKNPVTNRRRSHDIIRAPTRLRWRRAARRRGRCDTTRTARSPTRPTNARNGLMMSSDERNAIARPTAISRLALGDSCPATSSKSWANAADIVGIATKNENSAAAVRLRPRSNTADDRGARPRHAGHAAPGSDRRRWRARAAAACPLRVRRPASSDRRSSSEHHHAADDERDGQHARALIEDAS